MKRGQSGADEQSECSEWLEALGVMDAPSGHAAAISARDRILEPGRKVLATSVEWRIEHLVFQGLLARAQALHEAAVAATDADNPHAAFTLLRAYAENAAAILYAKDKPERLKSFWDRGSTPPISVGRITNYAEHSQRFGGFRGIYAQLSQFAHPQALGILASSSTDQDATVQWSSSPQFRRPDDKVVAYGWAIELAEATHHLLFEFAQRYQLGYFAEVDKGRPADT
jgi:hypothetical protein